MIKKICTKLGIQFGKITQSYPQKKGDVKIALNHLF